jgi:hypothetical protein
MRVRAVLLIPLICAALMAFAGAASALQIGRVNVPLTVPPVPALAPVVGTNPIELSDANVNVTPNDGVAIGVTIPGSVGPVTVSPDPSSVQVTVDPSGVAVTTTPDSSASTPAAGSDSAPATDASGSDASSGSATSDPATSGAADSPPTALGSKASSPVSDLPANRPAEVANASTAVHSRAKPSTDPFVGAVAAVAAVAAAAAAAAVSAVPGMQGSTASIGGSSRGATPLASAPKEVAVPDAVNASLQHAAPGGSWTLAREAVTGRFALWLALLAVLGVIRWALIGLVRDARRQARFVSSV